jgi:phage gp46-like protein|tara:strand:+ start:895 stop:1341 length:447 start_codon:yes stop_codon:yes gene_type:complete
MTAKHDAKLTHNNYYYDISFDDAGNLETEDSFNSAIINTILSEERATSSEVPIASLRRGWIGNLDSDETIGSRFWVYNQQRIRQVEINLIKSEVSRALQRTFVETGLAISQRVRIRLTNQRVEFIATLERRGSESFSEYVAIWDNTGI